MRPPQVVRRGIRAAVAAEEGSVSVMTAICLLILTGIAALVLDVGLLQLTRRDLQGATDVAALAAARKPADAAALAGAQAVDNGFPASIRTVVPGVWDPAAAPGARFTAAPAAAANAVRISAETSVPLFFSRLLTGNSAATVSVRATASNVPLGAFSIGSGLAAVDAGLANAVLGGLLGTSIDLSAVAWQGLVNGQVDALGFLDALAVQAGVAAGTYAQLADTDVAVGNVLSALVSVLGDPASSVSDGATLAAVQALIGAGANGPGIRIGDLLDLGFWREQPVGSSGGSVLHGAASLNVFDLVTAAAQIGGAESVVSLPAGISIPGLVNGTIRLSVIQATQSAPPQPTDGRLVLGPVGIRASTAQVRLALDLKLLDTSYLKAVPLLGPLVGSLLSIDLPLYIDVAPAAGQLTDVSCAGDPLNDTTMTVTASSGIARVAVGTVPDSILSGTGAVSLPGTATLVNVAGLLQVSASASAQAGQGGPADLVFTRPQITARTPQSIISGNTTSTLVSSLATSLQAPGGLRVTLLSVLPIDLGIVAAAVLDTIRPVLTALDPILDGLLRVLGVRLGYAEVRPLGVRCGIPALVN